MVLSSPQPYKSHFKFLFTVPTGLWNPANYVLYAFKQIRQSKATSIYPIALGLLCKSATQKQKNHKKIKKIYFKNSHILVFGYM